MAEEKTGLGNPVDVMYLIHKALRAEAIRVETLARELGPGDSLQRFKLAFNTWVTALVYHADQEDRYMTGPLKKSIESGLAGAGRGPGAQEVIGSGLTDEIKSAVVAQEDELHGELVDTIEDVLTVLNDEIGKTSLITRTKQHLYSQVVALRIAQEDHLDTEEALIVPIAREQLSQCQQMEMARAMLIDAEAQDPRWPVEWIARDLPAHERKLIADLETRLQVMPAAAD
ncbi:MAG: hemerythrin domain-containing protein [Chloroflexi bacterium]|nr:hemerythrin domain-containing protein [Chloroflexota bacterium]